MSQQDARAILQDINKHSQKDVQCKWCLIGWTVAVLTLPILMIVCGVLQ